jgi:hypothetical protein
VANIRTIGRASLIFREKIGLLVRDWTMVLRLEYDARRERQLQNIDQSRRLREIPPFWLPFDLSGLILGIWASDEERVYMVEVCLTSVKVA